jgi:hypothetical protein
MRRLRLPRSRSGICLRFPRGEVVLTMSEARLLVATLLPDRRSALDTDATLVGPSHPTQPRVARPNKANTCGRRRRPPAMRTR